MARRNSANSRPQLEKFAGAAVTAAAAALLSGCGGTPTANVINPPPVGNAPSAVAHYSPSDSGTSSSVFVKHRPTYLYAGAPNATIFIYKATATGNAKPVGKITGSKTQLGNVQSLIIPRGSNKLWVNNYATPDGSISEFSVTARNNTAPLNVIAGSATQINGDGAPYIDAAGNIYSASVSNSTINYFSPGSSGNVAPARIIAGPATMLNQGDGISMNPRTHNLYIANLAGNNILAFNPTANGNVPPLFEIGGATSMVSQPADLAFGDTGSLFVADSNAFGGSSPAILVFAPAARGDVAPIRDITGPNTTLDIPVQIRVDALGYIYVADRVGVKVFAPNANGNVAPVQSIAGPFSGLAI